MKEQNTFNSRQGMAMLFSVILHLVLLVLVIAASAMPVKEKERIMKVRLASVKKPEPPPVQEVKLPEPPKPDPPKPEPPKPEPPKPEPPKPEPPKPEPPKQVAKPDPPKPPPKPKVKPLPDPKPVVKNPPKEQPKPPEKPKQETPKPKSLAERLAEGRKQTQPVQQATRKSGKEIEKRLRESLNTPQTTPAPNDNVSAEMAVIEVETRSYAEEVVRPYIQRNWREPSKGELDVRNPTGVEIEFTVYASGSISNARIVKMSNSRVLNNSVQEFLRNMTRLSPLSTIGSNSARLTIIVTMSITN